ncbi:hypothetical protein ABVK25_002430 [Lepraria finkii]|uniref:Nucleoside-diphosphate kinase n=1 Tax=Lepraria finkii TaxID=1340010 RepID=A0ABR4BIZ1_9LECA
MNTVPERSVNQTEAKIVCVIGGPGVGKGTQCTRLAQDLKLVHISVGDLLRKEAEKSLDGQEFDIKAIMGHASLVPHTYVHDVLQRCLVQHLKDGRSDFLIDGFPRSKEQAQFFKSKESVPSAKYIYQQYC